MAKKVLIIDDDIDARFLIKVYLRKFDLEFIEARDGETGLELARQEKPDLIIMDYLLPKLSGYDMVKTIQKDEATKGIPVILATIAGFDLQMRELNIVKYISKPFSQDEIREAVKEALGDIPVKKEAVASTFSDKEVSRRESVCERKKILVADDDEEVRAYVQAILKDTFQVVLAKDGVDLIDKAIKEKPDLIICDVVMPGQSGYRSIKRLREIPEFARTPVIFNSGLVKDRELYETLKPEGPSCFMAKPFTKSEILSTIEKMLGG